MRSSVRRRGVEPQELLKEAHALIAELRNRRNVGDNWRAFEALMDANREDVIANFSSRWLISVCDTYADHAAPITARNALLVSLMFNMMRISDSLYEESDIRPERVEQIRQGWPPFYDGLHALHLDRQDTCLNAAKRLARALGEDAFLQAIYLELLRRAKANDNMISRFMRRSAKPAWVFPEDPLVIADNYGVV